MNRFDYLAVYYISFVIRIFIALISFFDLSCAVIRTLIPQNGSPEEFAPYHTYCYDWALFINQDLGHLFWILQQFIYFLQFGLAINRVMAFAFNGRFYEFTTKTAYLQILLIIAYATFPTLYNLLSYDWITFDPQIHSLYTAEDVNSGMTNHGLYITKQREYNIVTCIVANILNFYTFTLVNGKLRKKSAWEDTRKTTKDDQRLILQSIGELLFIIFPLSLSMFTEFSHIAFHCTFYIISWSDLLEWAIRFLCYFLISQGVIMGIYSIINGLTVYRESSLIEEPKFVNALLLIGGVLGPVPIVAYTFVAEPSYFPLTYQSYNIKQFLMLVTWNIFQMCLIISSIAQLSTLILFVIRKQFKLATRSLIIFLILAIFWKYIPEIEPHSIDTYIKKTEDYDDYSGSGVGDTVAYLDYLYEKLAHDYGLIIFDTLTPEMMKVYNFVDPQSKVGNIYIPGFDFEKFESEWLPKVEDKLLCCGIAGCNEYWNSSFLNPDDPKKCLFDCKKAKKLNYLVPGCAESIAKALQSLCDNFRFLFGLLFVVKLLLIPLSIFHFAGLTFDFGGMVMVLPVFSFPASCACTFGFVNYFEFIPLSYTATSSAFLGSVMMGILGAALFERQQAVLPKSHFFSMTKPYVMCFR
ncbi:unnamed protein product, partial [Mesorhabditis belari]|uniref:Uncharacterized protein n=1 Tax=Mesorhabditis belari TaxID=2138241 RepID=A0AAF3J2G5_9BILA